MSSSSRRTALVTGGAGAIGSAIVAALRAHAHDVLVLDREGDVACDLADEQAVRAAATAVLRRGGVDVLVHAAAAFDQAPLESLDAATWRHVQAVNVESLLWLAQELTPGMRERGFGRIVLVTSDTVWSPPAAALLPYVASKATLEGLARALAHPLGADGITINAVEPGLTRTPAAHAGMPAEAFEDVRRRQALPRTLIPEDVAGVIAFLASDAAAAVTGQAICADGGLVLR
ncbi:MAG TPA: SDR family oxidoreductase [Solirubrobacteraceae bacterium]|nr:SDR family oxidoreductase [Solirubrobacteraceae bacterium]